MNLYNPYIFGAHEAIRSLVICIHRIYKDEGRHSMRRLTNARRGTCHSFVDGHITYYSSLATHRQNC